MLDHDGSWLPNLVASSAADVGLRAEFALALATHDGRELVADMFRELTLLYSGHCFVIEGPTVTKDQVQVSFLYVGRANTDCEFPILVYWRPLDDVAQVVVEAPSFDVWLAQRLKLIKGRTGARGSKLPKAYGPLLQDQADRNFNGCWGHALSDAVTAHAPHIEDTCEYLIAPESVPRETLAVIGGDVADIALVERMLEAHGEVGRDGDVLTVKRDADVQTIDVATSAPPSRRFRIPCTSPLAAGVIRTLLSLPRSYIHVGFPYPEPQFLWMLKKSRALETPAEVESWLARY